MKYFSFAYVMGIILLCRRVAESRHNSEFIERPKEVIRADCGEEIKITCVAKAKDPSTTEGVAPEIEWWFRDNFGPDATTAQKIRELERQGRITIRNETFMAVRSVITIHNAQIEDQGVYQCRASASPKRHKQDVNVYQYWKIEEAPVNELQCGQTITKLASTAPIPVNDIIATSHQLQSLPSEARKSTIKFDVTTSVKNSFLNQTLRWKESFKTTVEGTAEDGATPKRQQKRSATSTTRPSGNAPGSSANHGALHIVYFLSLLASLFFCFVS